MRISVVLSRYIVFGYVDLDYEHKVHVLPLNSLGKSKYRENLFPFECFLGILGEMIHYLMSLNDFILSGAFLARKSF